MTYKPYDVVVVPFPFTDKSATKRRPALVLSTQSFNTAHKHLVLAMITTAAHSNWDSDVVLEKAEEAGLVAGSTVRMKLFTLDDGLVLRGLGRLAKGDRKVVKGKVGEVIG